MVIAPSTEDRRSSMAPSHSSAADPRIAAIPQVVAELRETFASGRTRTRAWRERQLRAMLEFLEREERAIVDAVTHDLGASRESAWLTDVATVRTEAKHALRGIRRWMRVRPTVLPLVTQPARGWTVPEPLGVVLVIGAWNYPVNLSLCPVVGALAAGNAVVLKPSEQAPATSAMLARLLPSYLDPDAFAVLEGGADETQSLLAQGFDHCLFTGSQATGRAVMAAAAATLTPVTLELGGKSPVIVAADADVEVAARRVALAKVTNSGQTCIAADYVLVERAVRDRFVAALGRSIGEFTADRPDGLPVLDERQFARLRRLGKGHGGRAIVVGPVRRAQGPMRPAQGPARPARAPMMPVTIVVDPDPESPLMQDEIFGPLVPVVTVDSFEDALSFVAARPHPLVAYVFTASRKRQREAARRIAAGAVVVNHVLLHAVAPPLPFGGVGASGSGSYHGRWGFETFSHRKPVLIGRTRPDLDALYPPITPRKAALLRRAF